MPEPTAFFSHFRIKKGTLDDLQELTRRVTADLQAAKPRTALFLVYLDEGRGVISFLHAFADAEAMDIHIEGSDERSRKALQYMEPLGWEVYGPVSESASETLRQAAAASGASFAAHPEFVAGFLRVGDE